MKPRLTTPQQRRIQLGSLESDRAAIRAKVQPEVDAMWAAIEKRQAEDTAARNERVRVGRIQRQAENEARRVRTEREERDWQRLVSGEYLTDDEERVSMGEAQEASATGGQPGKQGVSMAKLSKKQAATAKAGANGKAESNGKAPKAAKVKKGAFCLMTGAQTTGSRFSGLGTDAKFKSSLINAVLDNPKATHTVYDHESGEKQTKPAIEILRGLGWLPFLEKSRESRKKKADGKAKREQEAAAAKK